MRPRPWLERPLELLRSPLPGCANNCEQMLAEGVGFEPTLRFPVNTLSKRAPSATRPSLRIRCHRGARMRFPDDAHTCRRAPTTTPGLQPLHHATSCTAPSNRTPRRGTIIIGCGLTRYCGKLNSPADSNVLASASQPSRAPPGPLLRPLPSSQADH